MPWRAKPQPIHLGPSAMSSLPRSRSDGNTAEQWTLGNAWTYFPSQRNFALNAIAQPQSTDQILASCARMVCVSASSTRGTD